MPGKFEYWVQFLDRLDAVRAELNLAAQTRGWESVEGAAHKLNLLAQDTRRDLHSATASAPKGQKTKAED